MPKHLKYHQSLRFDSPLYLGILGQEFAVLRTSTIWKPASVGVDRIDMYIFITEYPAYVAARERNETIRLLFNVH